MDVECDKTFNEVSNDYNHLMVNNWIKSLSIERVRESKRAGEIERWSESSAKRLLFLSITHERAHKIQNTIYIHLFYTHCTHTLNWCGNCSGDLWSISVCMHLKLNIQIICYVCSAVLNRRWRRHWQNFVTMVHIFLHACIVYVSVEHWNSRYSHA